MNQYGLRKNQLKEIIMDSVNSNPDLRYYINDDYIMALVDLMADGVAQAIYENTDHVIDEITRKIH